MGISDGWVGERISSDHTVIPDLNNHRVPAPIVLEQIVTDERNADFDEGYRESQSRLGKVVVGAVMIALLGFGGLVGWPALSAYLEEAEPPVAELAMATEPTQRFVISGGKIYLEGSVPDEAISLRIQDAAQRALGADRVINNFEISDQAYFDPSQPVSLSVAETVLFDTGIASVADEYEPLIDLAVQLLTSKPNALLTVIGHTDDRGPDEVNLRLSLDRATAVANEINARGIDQERLDVEGRGETQPIESNESAEGRSANRRVEFLISGLLN
jgi:outer membrane protein OmpA-like peptidoglycan-associated protein